MVKPDGFHISLPKTTYYAGETVVGGTVALETTQDIKCRSVKFRIVGEGFCKFKYQRGGETETATHEITYFRETHTLWGRFFRTETIDGGGQNVIFGPPYSPNEGVMMIPCKEQEAPLICRVMDEDWGKKDDVVGEVVIKSPAVLVKDCAAAEATNPDGTVTLDLRYKGKEGNGTITLSARWQQTSDGTPTLQVKVRSALGLRQAEWGISGGKNDVYVQIYPAADMEWDEAKALPEPPKSEVLPAGQYTFDIPELKLPDKLPCTFEPFKGNYKKDGHVRYYVEASIDIAWEFDPFVRIPFSVSSRLPSALISGSVPCSVPEQLTYPTCCCGCICCCADPTGTVAMEVMLSSNGGAPGEWLVVSGTLTNGTANELALTVTLVQTAQLKAEGLTSELVDEWVLMKLPIAGKEGADAETKPVEIFEPFMIPTVPSSYHGGMLKEPAWEAKIREMGMTNPLSWLPKDPVSRGNGTRAPCITYVTSRPSQLVPWHIVLAHMQTPSSCVLCVIYRSPGRTRST